MPAATASTSLIVTGIAGKKLVENVVVDLYELAKRQAGFHLKKWKAANHADTIYKRIKQLRFVKTILQSEKEIELTSFYHPSRIKIGNKRAIVHQLADLNQDCNVVIEGTVGQGKSIFLRYIASVEFCTTRRIPVFIELRRCRQGLSILEMALNELKVLGFEMTNEVFQFFVSQGKILLMLDAFDEVKEELRQDIIAEVEGLIREHEPLRVVITTRPQSGISTSSLFRVFQLCPLDDKEYEQVIRRMAQTSDVAEAIISGIRKDAAQVAPLLTTPLMVALLMVRYKIDQSLPQNSASFYDSLFSLLLQRHDKSKGGYIRPRKSGVGDAVLEDFFNALCFVTRKANENSFKRVRLTHFAKESLKIIGGKGDLDKILADIVEITCLIISDGDECRFIHKSVQEYHAALFIQEQPDETVIAFYRAIESKWQNWQQELLFLEQIDRYRFLKHFQIKEITKLLTLDDGTILRDAVTDLLMMKACGNDRLNFPGDSSGPQSLTVASTGSSWPGTCLLPNSPYVHEVFEVTRIDPDALPIEKVGGERSLMISQLLNSPNFKQKTGEACSKFCNSLQDKLREAEAFVAQVEGMKTVFQF